MLDRYTTEAFVGLLEYHGAYLRVCQAGCDSKKNKVVSNVVNLAAVRHYFSHRWRDSLPCSDGNGSSPSALVANRFYIWKKLI